MKKMLHVVTLFLSLISWSQQEFSTKWEDFFSYNNVKDFVKTNNQIIALVDNAVFIYNTNTNQYKKLSSVQGLSGESTSSIYFDEANKYIIVGYENGLLEIIDKDYNIFVATNIRDFNFIGNKAINGIISYNNKLYLSTSFAIVEYNLENLEFGDTFFIGNQSSEIKINQVEIFNNTIYAATENGVYYANVNSNNLVDFNVWTQLDSGNFTHIKKYNNQLYATKNRELYTITNKQLNLFKSYPSTIVSLASSPTNLTISTPRSIYVNNTENIEVFNYTTTSNSSIYFKIQKGYVENNTVYIATENYGILKSTLNTIENFTEIHPQGPISNSIFSINAKDNHLWLVYGGYGSAYAPNGKRSGVSHYNDGSWVNIPYSDINVYGLVNVTFHPENVNRVYISSWGAGMVIIEDNNIVEHWTHENSGLEKLTLASNPNYVSIRINGSNFDNAGNLWVANAWVNNKIKKFTPSGEWYSVDMSNVITNTALGLNELKIDQTNTVFIGSRRNGVLAYNENGNKKRALTTEFSNGSLPDLNVRTIQPDNNDRLWIGTLKGLVVLYNASQIFNGNVNAEPVLITENGTTQKLLGNQTINSIEIDGAGNKWIGTAADGVVQVSSSGEKVLNTFTKSNSPLPSNKILKIAVDKTSGKVYFGTAKGVVAFNSNVSGFGTNLPEVYAYPNPALKNHEQITISGRFGAKLPEKTNIKIVDTAGNLVFETNVNANENVYGGKVIWNKKNLAGNKVASGIYMVLLSSNNNKETAVAKIAIIN